MEEQAKREAEEAEQRAKAEEEERIRKELEDATRPPEPETTTTTPAPPTPEDQAEEADQVAAPNGKFISYCCYIRVCSRCSSLQPQESIIGTHTHRHFCAIPLS